MLGSTERPLRVAIVGSGPSGFYAAEELLRAPHSVEVTMIERLPVPYGLVRSGVAPDHPKLKQPILVYDCIGRSEGFRYFGNVHVGRDVSVDELMETHHAVIFACGAEIDRRLWIPGENLPGSHSATEFVGWYNAHSDYSFLEFDLSQEVVAIVGQGNVALDVARILAKPVDQLRHTDIAQRALDALAGSRIREIHIFGRRGPAQAKFTPQELIEFASIPGCQAIVDAEDLELGQACRVEAADKMNRHVVRNLEILRTFATSVQRKSLRRCHFHFFRNPIGILGNDRVSGITLARTVLVGEPFTQIAKETGDVADFCCGLVFRSIGYRARAIEGLPYDDAKGVLLHCDGRLTEEARTPVYGKYATGWIKRGASGVIGTNRADSLATVRTLLSDLQCLDQRAKSGAAGLEKSLQARTKRYVTYENWRRIDHAEVVRGQARSKPREKFTRVEDMLLASVEDADRGNEKPPVKSVQ